MEHLVRYELASGETRYDTVTSLEAAISLVERLRNEDESRNVEVFRHVPLEFKTYYKVVVADQEAPAGGNRPAGDNPPPGSMPLSPPAQPKVQVHEETAGEAEQADNEGSGEDGKRSSLFSRG